MFFCNTERNVTGNLRSSNFFSASVLLHIKHFSMPKHKNTVAEKMAPARNKVNKYLERGREWPRIYVIRYCKVCCMFSKLNSKRKIPLKKVLSWVKEVQNYCRNHHQSSSDLEGELKTASSKWDALQLVSCLNGYFFTIRNTRGLLWAPK